jgi:hypothetical protein
VDLSSLVSLVSVAGTVTGTAAWLIHKRMQLRLVRHVYDKDGVDAAVKMAEATRTDPAEVAAALRGNKEDTPAIETPKPLLAIESAKPDPPPGGDPGKAA